jgi:hypothetical protein
VGGPHRIACGLRRTGEIGRALLAAGLSRWRFTAHERLTMPVLVVRGIRSLKKNRNHTC